LNGEATDDEIKKQYRNFTLILHPDKCKDERAKDGFFIVE
jgi:curved DNA-binding protein CbpA